MTVDPLAQSDSTVYPVEICTHNIAAALGDAAVTSSISDLLGQQPDVIGLQEMNNRQDLTAGLPGYSTFHPPDHDSGGGSPFLWRTDRWDASSISTGVRHTSPPGNYGPGAGPTVLGPGIATYFRGWHRYAGRWIMVINEHMVPSIYNPKRLELWKVQCRYLADMAWNNRGRGTIFVIGDHNNTPGSRYYAPFRERGLVNDNPRTITHPVTGRIIDLVWRLDIADPKRASVTTQQVLNGYPSDHKPVIIGYTFVKSKVTPDTQTIPVPGSDPDEVPADPPTPPDDDTTESLPRKVKGGPGQEGVELPGGWVLDDGDEAVVTWDEWQTISGDTLLTSRLVDLGTTTDPVLRPPSYRDIQRSAFKFLQGT